MRIIPWSREQAEKELVKRLGFAKNARQKLEATWVASERAVFQIPGLDEDASAALVGNNTLIPTQGNPSPELAINTVFRNYRFQHSQLSSNPPAIAPRPTSSDLNDRRRSDAADRLGRYALREYEFQDKFDLLSGNTLLYGTGILKMIWNPEEGEFLSFDKATGDVLMTGDIELTVPVPWTIFVDPDAENWREVRYVFERMDIPYEEALSRWPDFKDMLDSLRKGSNNSTGGDKDNATDSPVNPVKYDCIELYQYWEKGLPTNGMLGRFAWCTREGKILGDIDISPARVSVEKDENGDIVIDRDDVREAAYLPYIWFTDVDNIANVWGKATVAYQIPLQEIHNSLLNTTIDNARAHGVARMILDETAEISDDSITNNPYDIIKKSGNGNIQFIPPLAMPGIMGDLLQLMAKGIDDMAGMNESMLGQQSRETSGFSMQYATQQGNMLRHRLFKKYTMCVEDAYKMFFNLVIRHWKTSRTIQVLGKEKAFEAVDLSGADVNGGFDFVAEYGVTLSLDPMQRRQELMTMMPLFEKAGVSQKTILRMTKLNELENLYDEVELASQRQQEVFEDIIANEQPVKPREMQDHAGMLEYGYQYLMSAEFRDLEDNIKELIEQHLKEREQMAAAGPQAAAGAPAAAQPGAAMPGINPMSGGALPPPAGSTGAQTDVTQLSGAVPKG